MSPTPPLTHDQLNGLACCICGRDDLTFLIESVEAGTLGERQLFRCPRCDLDGPNEHAINRAKAIFADSRYLDL